MHQHNYHRIMLPFCIRQPLFQLIGEHSESESFICEFLKSESNYKALIRAYKNEPRLWNHKQFPKVLNNHDRTLCLERITLDIKNTQNIELSTNQVDMIIRHMRISYLKNVKRFKSAGQRLAAAECNSVPFWYFSALSFIEPFLNNVTAFESHSHRTHLKKENIIQILEIYKEFPQLWNTNLAEYVSSNKRQEALQQMTEVVRNEVGLKIKESSLKRYLENIHARLYKEKCIINYNQGKVTKQNSIYYNHMVFLIDHVGPFNCSYCERKHKSPLYLKAHIYQHHHKNDPLTCPICGKKYEKLIPYVAHARRHMNDLPDECKVCGKRFIRLPELRKHMRTHNGERPYCCELCGASFTASWSLLSHLRRHKKAYTTYCQICSKGFFTKDELRSHMATHSNERNYSCSTCGKSFKVRKTLKTHELSHTEERNYSCPKCGKRYKNKIGVKQHLKKHRTDGDK